MINSTSTFSAAKHGTVSSKEGALLLLAVLVSLALRLPLLGRLSFTGIELQLSSLALLISRGVTTGGSAVPAYTGLTSLLFYLFEPSNWLARLVPALAGASLIALPFLWRKETGSRFGLILGLVLVIDPVFILFSRSINPGVIALAGLLWSVSFLRIRKPTLAGISLAIGFLSGAAFWNYLILLAITFLIAMLYFGKVELKDFIESIRIKTLLSPGTIIAFIATTVLLSTSFLLDPTGLGGLGSSLVGFVRQFSQSFEKPAYHPIYLIFAHSILPLLLCLLGFFSSKITQQRKIYIFLLLASAATILIGGFMSRSSFELLLISVGLLWCGGAILLSNIHIEKQDVNFASIFLAIFTGTILIFVSQNLRKLASLSTDSPAFLTSSLILAAGIFLLLCTWWLVKFAWQGGEMNRVMLMSLVVFLFVASFAGIFHPILDEDDTTTLEYLDASIYLPNDDVEKVLAEISLTGKTLPHLGSYQIQGLPAELEWYLRDFDAQNTQDDPILILSRDSALPESTAEFRGMNIVLTRYIDWKSTNALEYLRIMLGKETITIDEKAVLWIRTNMFTGANQ